MKYFVFTSSLLLGACSVTTTAPTSYFDNTMDIIEKSEALAPAGLAGQFQLTITQTSKHHNNIYLNTHDDYRDRRNVSVYIPSRLKNEIEMYYGQEPEGFFKGKTIVIRGEAKRKKISLICNGRETSIYYFQTHIDVSTLDQINVIN
ncbi:hypothetical protein PALB_13610 [Pseudoalteromonas luteoviolacea B = ATCC 29581]|nr:hypothetical protein PALB_13610 [Pseudoalteromonas luteoviolacea B = ATCC 29581]